MWALSTLRRWMKGAPGLWLAALFLATRLLAASMALAGQEAGPDLLVASAICHTGSDPGPADKSSTPDRACLVCPACHLVTQAALPGPLATAEPVAGGGSLGPAVPPPPATGPPPLRRVTAHPTGPPTALV